MDIVKINCSRRIVTDIGKLILGINGENDYETLKIVLDEPLITETSICQLQVKKPDGTKGYIQMTRVDDYSAEIEVKSSLLDKVGDVLFEVVVYNSGNMVFKSSQFRKKVKEAINATSTIEEDYPTIMDYVEEIHDMAVENAGDISDIQEDLENIYTKEEVDNLIDEIDIPTKTSDLTNDSGFINKSVDDLDNYYTKQEVDGKGYITKNVDDLTNYYKKSETYTKEEVNQKVSSVYKYKGSVPTYADLPSTDLNIGDVYNVESDGSNYAWDGSTWDKLGGNVDLSSYYTKTQTDNLLNGKQEEITSDNKLNADLVDDSTSTNKFVTSAEKTQISTNTTDISNIKNGTNIDSFGDVESALGGKEDVSNKSQVLDTSTEKYPSNKAVKDSQDIQDSEIAELEEIASNIPTTTGTGESITIDNTMKCKHVSDELGGNTDQETTEGKNLLPRLTQGTSVFNGKTYTVDENGILEMSGTPTSAGTKTIQLEYPYSITNETRYLYLFNNYSDATFGVRFMNGSSRILEIVPSTENSKVELSQYSGQTITAIQIFQNTSFTNTRKISPMISASDTETTFEKYTNGASPNPDYPQDVNVVTGDNTITISNKNLFGNLSNGYYDTNGDYQTSNTRWCTPKLLKGNNTALYFYGSTSSLRYGLVQFDENNNLLERKVGIQNTYSFGTNTYSFAVFFYDTSDISDMDLQVSFDPITTYIPHQEQVYPINLGSIELAKIGSYQDKLFKAISGDVVYDSLSDTQKEGLNSGSWYKYGVIGKLVLDGTENWEKPTTNLYNVNNITPNHLTTANIVGIISDNYVGGQTKASNSEFMTSVSNLDFAIGLHTNGTSIRVKDTRGLSLSDFKSQLSTNNVTVYYVLSTPTFTEITDETLISQLENWRNSKSYNGQTNISQTNDDKAFVISYTTLKDVYSELDSRIKALEG